ncbi:MAG: cation:proton antiporter [Actinomycetota bacterium]|nr:cation:proton antiporter [Actinomycetota bacterium]
MITVVAAASADSAVVFIELGAVGLVLAVLARVAGRFGITAIPFYLVAGLAVGEGGLAPLDVSARFIDLAGDIGVLLLLLTLGLEYGPDNLRRGLRTGAVPGAVDAVVNFTPGFLVGLALGWGPSEAVLLGGVCWVSSSGVASKVLADLDRMANRETAAVLNLLVIEDLAMAVFLPIAGAMVVDSSAGETATTVAIGLAAVGVILTMAMRWGDHLSRLLSPASDEALLLAVFGLTLLVGGLAEEIEVSAAIGAFLVGLALSGVVQARASALLSPLRDLFAATFFLSFSFTIDPGDLPAVLVPAAVLALLGIVGKIVSGWVASRNLEVDLAGRLRAGTALIARGEFSIVIAALAAATVDGDELGALAAAFVLITAIVGPLAAKYADPIAARLPFRSRSGGSGPTEP